MIQDEITFCIFFSCNLDRHFKFRAGLSMFYSGVMCDSLSASGKMSDFIDTLIMLVIWGKLIMMVIGVSSTRQIYYVGNMGQQY